MKRFSRRLSALISAVMLLLALSVPAVAVQSVSVQRDGVILDGVTPILLGDWRSYLPAESLAAALDARWTEGTVLARSGLSVDLSGLSHSVDGVDYFPIRAAAEPLGYRVGWDRTARTVLLADTGALAKRVLADGEHRLLASLEAACAGSSLPAVPTAALTLENPLLRAMAPDAAALAGACRPDGANPLGTILAVLPLDDADSSYADLLAVADGLRDDAFTGGKARFASDGSFTVALSIAADGGRMVGYSLDLSASPSLERYASPALLSRLGLPSCEAQVRLTVDGSAAASSAVLTAALQGVGSLEATWSG